MTRPSTREGSESAERGKTKSRHTVTADCEGLLLYWVGQMTLNVQVNMIHSENGSIAITAS